VGYLKELSAGPAHLRSLIFDHDELHEFVRHHDRPWYEKFKTDPSKALLDRTLFEAAPLEHQIEVRSTSR
jgi:hypothetical protein